MLHTSRYIYIYTYFLLICDLKVDDRPETWIAYACMINIYKYCMDIALKCLLLFIIIRKKILKWRAPLFSAELEWTEACWAVNDTTRKCAQVLSPKVRATIPDSVWHSRIPLGTAGFRWAQPDSVGHSRILLGTRRWCRNGPITSRFPRTVYFGWKWGRLSTKIRWHNSVSPSSWKTATRSEHRWHDTRNSAQACIFASLRWFQTTRKPPAPSRWGVSICSSNA
jgi:hypothetical protein